MSGFTEDEARQIFARAAERQHAVASRGEGLSLDDLQAIGAEAGLDPEHVAAAVAELRSGPAVEPVVVAGVDLTPRVVRVLPGELTDDAWADLVGRLRRTFGAKGVPSEIGRVREWTSGPTSRLHVVAEPVEGGTRVTMETSKAHEAAGLRGVIPFAVFMSLALSALFVFGDFDATVWILPVLTLGLCAAIYVGVRAWLARWSDRRRGQFESLMDQAELLVRAEASTAAEAPRLDLDALAEPEHGPDAPARRRERS